MKESYSEKLKNPKWQKLRLKILERDNWTCQNCFDAESTLHVHHKIYEYGKNPWEYPSNNFITLCEECHNFETTDRKESETLLLNALKAAGFLHTHLNELAYAITESKEVIQWGPDISAIGATFYNTEVKNALNEAYFNYLRKQHAKK